MSNDTIFLLCFAFFFTGALLGGWYAAWFNKSLKKHGYLKYELTDKFHKEFKTGPHKNKK